TGHLSCPLLSLQGGGSHEFLLDYRCRRCAGRHGLGRAGVGCAHRRIARCDCGWREGVERDRGGEAALSSPSSPSAAPPPPSAPPSLARLLRVTVLWLGASSILQAVLRRLLRLPPSLQPEFLDLVLARSCPGKARPEV